MDLVVGASGYLGSLICKHLINSGRKVRAMVRPSSNTTYLKKLGVELVEGDLDSPVSLTHVVEGCETVFYTASTAIPTKKGETMADDGARACRMINTSKEAGVDHFIYISAAIPKGVDVALVQCKAIGEECLKQSGLNYTILRCGAFMEIHLALLGSSIPTVEVEEGLQQSLNRPWKFGINYYNSIRHDIDSKGIAHVNGKGLGKMSYVATQDVANIAVECLEKPECKNTTLEIGSQGLTYLDAVEIFSEVFERPLKVKKTPLIFLKLFSKIVGFYEPAGAHLLQALAALSTIDASLDTRYFKEVFPDYHLQTPQEFLLERIEKQNAS